MIVRKEHIVKYAKHKGYILNREGKIMKDETKRKPIQKKDSLETNNGHTFDGYHPDDYIRGISEHSIPIYEADIFMKKKDPEITVNINRIRLKHIEGNSGNNLRSLDTKKHGHDHNDYFDEGEGLKINRTTYNEL